MVSAQWWADRVKGLTPGEPSQSALQFFERLIAGCA